MPSAWKSCSPISLAAFPVRVRRCFPAMARRHASAGRRHRRARSVRRLQLLDRPSGARTYLNLQGQGKTVKILCIGKKGYDQLRRQYEKHIIDLIELARLRQLGFGNADPIGKKIIALFEAGEFDVATLFYLAIPLGDPADSDGAAAHPGAVRTLAQPPTAAPTNMSRGRTKFCRLCCRATFRCRFSAHCWKTPLRNRARA